MNHFNEKVDELLKRISDTSEYVMESYHNFENEADYLDYRKLLIILMDEKLIKQTFSNEDRFHITSFGIKVIDEGGWLKYLEKKIAKESKKEKKEELDLKISEFQVRTKWLPYWISGFSLLISIAAFIRSSESEENLKGTEVQESKPAIIFKDTVTIPPTTESDTIK